MAVHKACTLIPMMKQLKPTEESATIALRTQQIIAEESGAADVVDPLGGSHYVEYLTNEIYNCIIYD